MPMRSVVAVLLCAGVAGCQTPLDKKQLALIQAWGEANVAFATAIEVYQSELDSVVRDYLDYERQAQRRAFERFVETNSENGVLVETDENDQIVRDADGNPLSMKTEALEREVTFLLAQLKAIDDKDGQWRAASGKLTESLALFRSMNSTGMATSEEIAQARSSAQALLESSLGALAGFAIGAAAAP